MTDERDDLEALAAEYALGTLDDADRDRADNLIAEDPEFARRVDDWTERLARMGEAVPPVDPPAGMWRRIEADLPSELRFPSTTQREEGGRVAAFWRWWALAASAVAAALVIYVAAFTQPTVEGRFVAVLNEGPAKASWLITVDMAEQRLTIRPLTPVAAEDKALELWLVSGGETKPRSLGLLDPRGPHSIVMPAAVGRELPRAAAFAISLEPAGGSTTGLPTGPVVYQGALLPVPR